MKIAYITSSRIPSYTANSIQVMKVCDALAQLGHAVCLWSIGSAVSSWLDLSKHYGLTNQFAVRWLPSVPLLKRYDFSLRAVWQAVRWQADLVYTILFQVAFMALVQKKAVILELHNVPSGRVGPQLFRFILKHKGKKRILITTHALYDTLKAKYNFYHSKEDAMIAPSGTDLDRYRDLPIPPKARNLLGLKDGFTIGYTGSFYRGRGIEFMTRLMPYFPDINFLFVGGEGKHVLEFKDLLSQKKIKNATVTGFIENANVALYQAAADILIMPHEYSVAGSGGGDISGVCSPLKMFDYLASGRAIISSDLPVLREVLNQNNAVLCPPEDFEAWKQAIQTLRFDSQKRIALGCQAQKDALGYSLLQREEMALGGF